MRQKTYLVRLYFTGMFLFPLCLFAQETDREIPRLFFDGKTFTIPSEKTILQKGNIPDTLLGEMPIEMYIQPLNLKISEYKFALPKNPSQTIKRALLIHLVNLEEDGQQNMLMSKAKNNVAQMLNLSGTKQIKSIGFNLDPVDYIRRRKEIKNAEKAQSIIRELNKLDAK